MTSQQRADLLLSAHQSVRPIMRIDPSESKEVAVEMRVVGLISATKFLDDHKKDEESRKAIIGNVDDIELVRDRLSRIIDDARGVR